MVRMGCSSMGGSFGMFLAFVVFVFFVRMLPFYYLLLLSYNLLFFPPFFLLFYSLPRCECGFFFLTLTHFSLLCCVGRVRQAAILRGGQLRKLHEIFRRRSVRLLPRFLLLRPVWILFPSTFFYFLLSLSPHPLSSLSVPVPVPVPVPSVPNLI
jgi:hypothetical protein